MSTPPAVADSPHKGPVRAASHAGTPTGFSGGAYTMVQPPSTAMVCPVM
jgi:hypothetical protein